MSSGAMRRLMPPTGAMQQSMPLTSLEATKLPSFVAGRQSSRGWNVISAGTRNGAT
jgi:hypothetical protein